MTEKSIAVELSDDDVLDFLVHLNAEYTIVVDDIVDDRVFFELKDE